MSMIGNSDLSDELSLHAELVEKDLYNKRLKETHCIRKEAVSHGMLLATKGKEDQFEAVGKGFVSNSIA